MRKLLCLLTAAMLLGAFVAPASAAASGSPCQGMQAAPATIGLPSGFWTDGEHTYSVLFAYSDPYEGWVDGPYSVTFTVSPGATLADTPVFLRYFGLSATPGPPTPFGDTINPAQVTVFQAGYVIAIPGDFPTIRDGQYFWAHSAILFSWDGGSWMEGNKGPLTNVCAGGVVGLPNGKVQLNGQIHRHYAF